VHPAAARAEPAGTETLEKLLVELPLAEVLERASAAHTSGKLLAAVRLYRAVLRSHPDLSVVNLNLGNVLHDLGRVTEAAACFREVLRLNPANAGAHNNLGTVLKELGRYAAAEASYRETLRLKPDHVQALNNLGNLLKDLGRLAEAEACYRQVLQLKPGFAEAHSNFLFSLNYSATLSAEARLEEARLYGTRVSLEANPKFTAWRCLVQAPRLKIGFVSGDFRIHPVGFFLEGLLANLDRNLIEPLAYATTLKEDAQTSRIRPFFSKWTALYGQHDRDAAGLIHADAPHILIDLAGHSAHNRLPVFAYRPAPLQIAWLGYCATTGLPEMDYVLGDPCVTPPGENSHFTESVLRLPETYLCFAPPADDTAVGPLPALTNGFVTFGCFNNLAKLGEDVLALWTAVLAAVPGSKLFLRSMQFQDAEVAAALLNRFAAQGITADRLLLEGYSATRAAVFNAYNRVDIALDPFPYPGVTTSVEALWMGVPVLTMRGQSLLSRNGETIAQNAGLADWIASDATDYIGKARQFAGDLPGLASLRAGLRLQLLRSPLLDAARFARHFEQTMLELWRNRQQESMPGVLIPP